MYLWGRTTAAATAVQKTKPVPMNSSRTDSQRLDVTNGHQHWVDVSNSRLCLSPNLPCSLKALTEVKPCAWDE